MPFPSSSTASMRPDLSTPFMQLTAEMSAAGFVAHQVLPIIGVKFASNTFPVIPAKAMLQTPDMKRSPRGNYNRDDISWTTGTYATHEYGMESRVDDNEARNYASYFDYEQIVTDRAKAATLRAAEVRCATAMFNTSVWTGSTLTTAVGTAWSNLASSTPITDVKNAKKKVWDLTGIWPDCALISAVVFENLRNCTQILDRITASGAGDRALPNDITVQMIADALGIRELIVAGMAKDSANEGQALSIASVYSDSYCSIFKKARTGDFREVCVGRTFHWDEDGSAPMGAVETYRDETVRSDIVRCRHQVDEKIIYHQAAHLLSNIT